MKIIFTVFGYILLSLDITNTFLFENYNLNPKSRLTHSNLIKQIFLITIYIITFLGFLVLFLIFINTIIHP